MKTVTIEAYDKDGNLLGKKDVEQPETLDELMDYVKEEKEILEKFWRSEAIDIQRKLRTEARGPSKESENVKIFKTLSPERQAEILAALANASK